MRKLRKGERYGLLDRSENTPDNIYNKEMFDTKTVYLNDAQIVKYGELIHVIAKEFYTTDFNDYRPTKVVNAFWSKYNLNATDQFNLFDLVLLAQGAVQHGSQQAKALDSFLKDFLSYMIASHTVHYMNQWYSPIGRYKSAQQVDEIKEGVRVDFVGRLSGLR